MLTTTAIVVLSDGDSDSDVAIVGSRPKTARVSTSPVFVRASRTTEVYSLIDTDTDSDSEDLDSVLVSASLRERRHGVSSTSVQQHHSASASTVQRALSTKTVSTETSRRSSIVANSRSILSVLDNNDWDKPPSPAVVTDSPEPHKKRRRTAVMSTVGTHAAQAEAREKEAAREERERQKLQEKHDRQRARDEAKVNETLARAPLTL